MSNTTEKKELNFELNLLPIIALLSVCIGFLLTAAVWEEIGSLKLKQGMGDAGLYKGQKEEPTLWITLSPDGKVELVAKNVENLSAKNATITIQQTSASNINIKQITSQILRIKSKAPQLTTALILPAPDTKYEDLIALIDFLKKEKINNLGLAPL